MSPNNQVFESDHQWPSLVSPVCSCVSSLARAVNGQLNERALAQTFFWIRITVRIGQAACGPQLEPDG
jgi:hypothetical protein